MKEGGKIESVVHSEQQKINAFILTIQGLPHANEGTGESFYESVSEKLTSIDVLNLKKLIEYSGK